MASTQAILAAAQEGRFVIEDFVPLADSLEWELGQQYWRERGSKAFISDPVPFTINNDGALSRRTAETFFASLVESEKSGPLEPVLYVLELGIGVGLFARFFLDAFQEICGREGKDYYGRLVYIAGDRSERMLADACRHGVFANHPGRYLVRVVNALEPGRYLADLVGPASRAGAVGLRAVFLNYVLDCLPAAHLKIAEQSGTPLTPSPSPPELGGEGSRIAGASPREVVGDSAASDVQRLCVRTCLARHVPLGEFTHLTAADLVRRARSGSATDRRTLMELYSLFASEYDYRPLNTGQGSVAGGLPENGNGAARATDDASLPYLDFALGFAREQKVTHLLHNHGAMESLDGLLAILHPQGFIAINDYGQVELEKGGDFEHQRFSQSTSVGLNFPLLKAYFGASGRAQWIEPDGENGHIYSRLVGHASSVPKENGHAGSVPHGNVPHGIAAATVKVFTERFGKAAWEWGQERWMAARANVQHGRVEPALSIYDEASERQPGNWILLNEIAWFLTFQFRNPAAGVAMARRALELNPACSAELWNTLGDAWYQMGKLAEAKSAYQRGLRVNPGDVKSRFNLAWVLIDERRYAEALTRIAEALALDETGEYYEPLVKKQNEILGRLAQRNQHKQFLLANRVSSKAGVGMLVPGEKDMRVAEGNGQAH